MSRWWVVVVVVVRGLADMRTVTVPAELEQVVAAGCTNEVLFSKKNKKKKTQNTTLSSESLETFVFWPHEEPGNVSSSHPPFQPHMNLRLKCNFLFARDPNMKCHQSFTINNVSRESVNHVLLASVFRDCVLKTGPLWCHKQCCYPITSFTS